MAGPAQALVDSPAPVAQMAGRALSNPFDPIFHLHTQKSGPAHHHPRGETHGCVVEQGLKNSRGNPHPADLFLPAPEVPGLMLANLIWLTHPAYFNPPASHVFEGRHLEQGLNGDTGHALFP